MRVGVFGMQLFVQRSAGGGDVMTRDEIAHAAIHKHVYTLGFGEQVKISHHDFFSWLGVQKIDDGLGLLQPFWCVEFASWLGISVEAHNG